MVLMCISLVRNDSEFFFYHCISSLVKCLFRSFMHVLFYIVICSFFYRLKNIIWEKKIRSFGKKFFLSVRAVCDYSSSLVSMSEYRSEILESWGNKLTWWWTLVSDSIYGIGLRNESCLVQLVWLFKLFEKSFKGQIFVL